jgi:subtilisin-like proprotein convertase family protein
MAFYTKGFSYCLSILLIFSLASPALAVVFTNPAAITISDAVAQGVASQYPSTIAVAGMTGTVTNVTVSLNNLNHTFPDDLDFMLVAPGGNNIVLMSDAGGSLDVTNTYLVFDDSAATTVADGSMFTGTFRPSQYVTGDIYPAPAPVASANTTLAAAFNGIDPNGTWNLYAVDDTGIDMGTLGNGWTVRITTTGTAATSFSNAGPIFLNERWGRGNAYPSTISVTGLTGAITDVNVTFTGISHLNPDDLDILLIGPTGKRILLLSDTGGTTDVVNQTVTLDDSAAATIPDGGPMVTGTFRPSNFGTGDTLHDVLPPFPSAATGGSTTLASVFNGTEPNGTWKLYIIDDATASAGSFAGGWSLDITAGGTYGAKRFTSSDFQGDGQTDVSIYRPSTSDWWTRDSSSYANGVVKWGASGDEPVPSDYDGDRRTDLAVFRAGLWIILNSSTSTTSFVPWGAAGDTPVPADYDGDGSADVAIWRSTTATFWVRQSDTTTTRVVQWGVTGDLPVRGHFEGTNGADFAVFRPSTGFWYILNNAGTSVRQLPWGVGTDRPVPADYDADGRTDIAIFRPSEGNWYILQSGTGMASIFHFGQNGDTPVPGDYDGDSRADAAVARGTAGDTRWYILNSGVTAAVTALREDSWGLAGDIPLPSTYIP